MGVIVIAHYRPDEGQKDAFIDLIREHQKTLRASGLITDRAFIEMEASDGTLLELFEWKSEDDSRAAHKDAAIQDIWRRMGEIGFFPAANELKEYSAPFAHFIPKDY